MDEFSASVAISYPQILNGAAAVWPKLQKVASDHNFTRDERPTPAHVSSSVPGDDPELRLCTASYTYSGDAPISVDKLCAAIVRLFDPTLFPGNQEEKKVSDRFGGNVPFHVEASVIRSRWTK